VAADYLLGLQNITKDRLRRNINAGIIQFKRTDDPEQDNNT